MNFVNSFWSTAIWLAMFVLVRVFLTRRAVPVAATRRTRNGMKAVFFTLAFAQQFLVLPMLARAQGAALDGQRQSLGSLTSNGDVSVNQSPAPSELTLYSGDSVRTGATGAATLTTPEDKSFQISRNSEVAFTEDAHYFAELKSGAIAVKSAGGAAGAVVRAGNFVVVPTNRNERTILTVERGADGTFLVTCTAGNAGILPLQGGSGLFLQAGRSARISPQGQLTAIDTAPAVVTPASTTAPAQSAGRSHRLWLYLGLAGGGIAAGTAAAIAAGGNHPPMSPSSP
jgi:hypothetical protein